MISAIVLAAGQSTRMGQQKMLMPWGQTSVIEQVVSTLLEAGVDHIYLVTGGSQSELKEALKNYKINYLFNKDFANGEMLMSVQVGLRGLGKEADAALLVLGDQPQIEPRTIQVIQERYLSTHHHLIVPSYQMHRGHPWLVEMSYWPEILNLIPPLTLHAFLNFHNEAIDYILVDSPSIIEDLDTQNDYSRYKP
jgi:molybdenum cofactor cytidylyltransferase